MNIKDAIYLTGGLSRTSKMPCPSFGLHVSSCTTGQKLRKISHSVCSKCYAHKGRYLFKNVTNAGKERIKNITKAIATENQQIWVDAMVFLIKSKAAKSGYFRWHDTGDIFSVEYLKMILDVVKATPEIKHFLPTKELSLVRTAKVLGIPDNLNIRVSALLLNKLYKNIEPSAGITSSAVFKCETAERETELAKLGHVCPGVRSHQCGECRACWDRNVGTVIYPQH